MYSILLIYLLVDVCISMRNFHIPHAGYFHHSELAMQHDNNYQHYDSYSSNEIVMRQAPRRSKFHRHFEESDSEYNYKCKCSCAMCQKLKPKPCCQEYCAAECAVQNNIVVVPYPVPFMVFNQSVPSELPPLPPTTTSSSTTTTTTTTTTTEPTTTTTTTESRKTLPVTLSTVPYFENKSYKRFKILNDNNLRRNMASNGLRSPKFGRIPKYGIVPIPENLALSLMQQIRKDQNNDQLRKRLALDKNLLDYTGLPIAKI